ncbi:hypothetical protein Tco_0920502 [Tanacetum coccineum]
MFFTYHQKRVCILVEKKHWIRHPLLTNSRPTDCISYVASYKPVVFVADIFALVAGFSALLLGRRYSWNKIVGCLLVAAGVVTAIAREKSLSYTITAERLALHIEPRVWNCA